MDKLKLLDAKKTTTMFLIDNNIENHFDDKVNKLVDEMSAGLNGIDTVPGLKSYIKKDKNSIDNLIALLGITMEKFKRIVSTVRLKKGFTFDSEWTTKTLRQNMINNTELMSEFCELFSHGTTNSTVDIPRFILSDFKIDKDVLARLRNRDYLTKLIKSKIITEYNNKCVASYMKKIRNEIETIAESFGLCFTNVKSVDKTDIKNVDAISFGDKHIVINIHFSLTTSSGQTKYYYDTVSPLWGKIANTTNLCLINILDGAGWIGRPSDYAKIFHSCSYFLNLSNISNLKTIIKEFLNV
ncbi:MAG: hypothetical protein LUD52_04810 [Opitutae bacterium]|nr:hypothetical protein [Opitutae bacterium]